VSRICKLCTITPVSGRGVIYCSNCSLVARRRTVAEYRKSDKYRLKEIKREKIYCISDRRRSYKSGYQRRYRQTAVGKESLMRGNAVQRSKRLSIPLLDLEERINQMHYLKESCVKCDLPYSRKTHQLDHIIPLAENGTNDSSNLQVLCVDCHKAKTGADVSRIALNKRVVRAE